MSFMSDSFGVGAGEGLAAVRGHQSGAQGMRVVKPVFSQGERGHHSPNPFIPGLMAAHRGNPFAGTSSKIVIRKNHQ